MTQYQPRIEGRWPAVALVFFLFSILFSVAEDWPQFLGSTRNGIYAGKDVAAKWPQNGPPVLWKKKAGQGFSGPSVASGKLIFFHRLDDKEVIECLDAESGSSKWKFDYATRYHDDFGFDEGPRATPAINDGRVYTCGAEGMLHCLDLKTGAKIWSVNTKSDFHAGKGFFGIACSPLVDATSVFLNVGGRDGAGIVAFDKSTGKIRWKSSEDEASYSSPVLASLGGHPCALVLTRSRLVAADPSDGRLFFDYPFRPPIHSSVTAAIPLVIDDKIFLSASYGTGAALLRVNDLSPRKIWESDDAISAHYATPVYHKGHLYGIHGRTDPGFDPSASLRCIELDTGQVKWEQPRFGAATLVLAGEELLILTERGELIRALASPSGFKEVQRAQILPNQVRAHPALANGLFYARNKDQLVCVTLRGK